MRGQLPENAKGREWRSSVGLSYPVANFEDVIAGAAGRRYNPMMVTLGKMMNR